MAEEIRIRMYRVGFGDCFLVTFLGPGKHILIDFGVHQKGNIGTMPDVAADIVKETGKKLELIVLTHNHRDHVSGFADFASEFAEFEIGEIWMPWTENPSDKIAAKLRKKQLALVSALEKHFAAMGAAAADPKYAGALAAVGNSQANAKGMGELLRGFGTGAKVRFFTGGEEVKKVGALAGLTALILGPPKGEEFLGKMDPPAGQGYLTAPGVKSEGVRPFPAGWAISRADAAKDHPEWLALPDDEKAIREHAEAPADLLALTLESIRNNTSLVILFRYRGKSLLFPGDAQWGNWKSWMDNPEAKDLLSEVDFIKIAHHGSHNATPKPVVEGLTKGKFAAMIPTQSKPFPTIPRKPLLAALDKQSGNRAVRSDVVVVPGAPKGPVLKTLPKGFRRGKLWVDYTLEV